MEAKKVGRPTDYTPGLAKEICDKVACTSQGIKKICKENEHWPSHNTIYRWLSIHKEFGDLYAQAKKLQVEGLIDEILEIADDTSHDTIVKVDEEGNEKKVCNSEWINRSRLRIDTRKWLAAKLCPRLYGDKLQLPIPLPTGAITLETMKEIGENALRLLEQGTPPDQIKTVFDVLKGYWENIAAHDLSNKFKTLEEKFKQIQEQQFNFNGASSS